MHKNPPLPLNGRRILLGISGGIAAYKSADLVRRLREAGAEVQVVMTEGAAHFITATTLQALSGRPVRDSLWDASAEAAMGHIELARWPDRILIAPASADLLARLAHGRADDLLSTLCLASDRPITVAPAMNRLMWTNPATQANIRTLRERGVDVLEPDSGDQACGEVGPGRMPEPTQIRDALIQRLSGGPLEGLRIVVNAGPTREAIDPVCAISNRSSGKMGFALAAALSRLGASVTLVAGPVALATPAGVTRVDVTSAAEMLAACLQHARDADAFVGAAAVADYTPVQIAEHKIKKGAEELTIQLRRTADILVRLRRAYPSLFMVGFAAETRDLEAAAREKLERKGLQMIAANDVADGRAFDRDDNALTVLWDGGQRQLPSAPKTELARALAELIAERLTAHRNRTGTPA